MKNNINNLIATPIAILFIAISAQLSIHLPESVSSIPITGQSFAVLIIAHLMLEKWGIIVVGLYLLVGMLGAPVFSDFSSGIAALTGPSGGYLIGFLISAYTTGKMAKNQSPTFNKLLLQMALGTVVILIIGYIGLFRFLSPIEAFMKGVKPYLLGGLIKVLLASFLLWVYYQLKGLMNNN